MNIYKRFLTLTHSKKLSRIGALPAIAIIVSTFSVTSYADCYSYDALGRLETSLYSDSSSNAALASTSYVLDEHGNRQTVQTNSAASRSCAQPSSDISQGEASAVVSDTPPENQVPTASDFDINLLLGATFTANAIINASDDDGEALVLSSAVSNHPANISVNISGGQGMVAVESIIGEGNFEIVYEVQDPHGATASATIYVNVTAPDDGLDGTGGDDTTPNDLVDSDPEAPDSSCEGCNSN